jgi:hypothetical protein
MKILNEYNEEKNKLAKEAIPLEGFDKIFTSIQSRKLIQESIDRKLA